MNSSSFLGTKNFTVDSSSWSVKDAIGSVNGKHISIKVKVNSKGDIREYVSGVPAVLVGQQLFTYAAALRETQKVKRALLSDQQKLDEIIETMSGSTEHEKYKNYLSKVNVQFAGCYSSGLHIFDDIGVRSYYRLDDGSRLNLSGDTRGVSRRDENMGYSVRVG